MSVDPWGGGSDLEPKLRLHELDALKNGKDPYFEPHARRVPYRQRPRVSVFDGLLLVIAAVAVLVVLASLR